MANKDKGRTGKPGNVAGAMKAPQIAMKDPGLVMRKMRGGKVVGTGPNTTKNS